VRIDHFDIPRNVPGANADILRTLKKFGFEWDGPIVYQSLRSEMYRAALDQLRRQGAAYPCTCSRREIAGNNPGICRGGVKDPGKAVAWRVRVDDEAGDFVVPAVVVDDAAEGITDVVRGADLAELLRMAVANREPAAIPRFRPFLPAAELRPGVSSQRRTSV